MSSVGSWGWSNPHYIGQMNKNNKNISPKKVKVPKLTGEDGQSQKLEEKIINVKKISKPLFGKDVNDPSERGHD